MVIGMARFAGLSPSVGYRPGRIVRERSSPEVAIFVEALGDEHDPQDEKDDQSGQEEPRHSDEVFPVLEEFPHRALLPSW